jgi:hypothetical protein
MSFPSEIIGKKHFASVKELDTVLRDVEFQ